METFIEKVVGNLQTFLLNNGFQFLGRNVEVILLFFLCTGVVPGTLKIFIAIKRWFTERMLIHDLHPYFSFSAIEDSVKYFVPTRVQKDSPTNEMELVNELEIGISNPIISVLIKNGFSLKSKDRIYLILGDSGMGKTTFMINLYSKYKRTFKFRKKKERFNIVLLPIGTGIENEIQNIEAKSKTILLLDGLDEDPESLVDIHRRLSQLILACRTFRKVVITCRTQFFSSNENIPKETNIIEYGTAGNPMSPFITFFVSPFNDDDIALYLRKRYGYLSIINWRKKQKAWRIIRSCPNLMVRPMLLSYIDDLIKTDLSKPLEYPHNAYEILIDKWIERETQRVPLNLRDQYRKNLYIFSIEVSRFIYENRIESGFFIDEKEIEKIANNNNIDLSLGHLKSRSLMNHNTEGRIKFAHKSILEYFIAKIEFARGDFATNARGQVVGRFPNGAAGIDQATKFLRDMIEEDQIKGDVQVRYGLFLNLYFLKTKYCFAPTQTISSLDEFLVLMKEADELDRKKVLDFELLHPDERIWPVSKKMEMRSIRFRVKSRSVLGTDLFGDLSKQIVYYQITRSQAELMIERIGQPYLGLLSVTLGLNSSFERSIDMYEIYGYGFDSSGWL